MPFDMVILAFAWFFWRTPRKTRLRRCWLERMRALKMNTREYSQTESGNVQTRRDSDSENLESDWARHCKFPESNWGALDSLRLLKEKTIRQEPDLAIFQNTIWPDYLPTYQLESQMATVLTNVKHGPIHRMMSSVETRQHLLHFDTGKL